LSESSWGAGWRAGWSCWYLPFLWHRQRVARAFLASAQLFSGDVAAVGHARHRDQPGIARVGGFYCAFFQCHDHFIVVIGILLLGRYLNQVALQQPEPLRTIVYTIYFLIRTSNGMMFGI